MHRRSLLVAVSLLAAAACLDPPLSGDPAPLPPSALQKELFAPDGEWWFHRIVTSVPYEAGFTFKGDGDLADRIRWRIEEKYLIAERSFAMVDGITDDVSGSDDYAAPVAVYPIRRHFDVLEGQIIEAPKRPWYERAWFDVDFGVDMVKSYRFGLNLVEQQGTSYAITEPDHPDAPIFTADFVDFTTHVTISPIEQLQIETHERGFCAYGILSIFVDVIDCAPVDVTFRTSIKRIPSDHDYEPGSELHPEALADWHARYFRVGRLHLDEERNAMQGGRERIISRYRIWERAHDADGQTIPYRERTSRVIPFYVNEEFPEDLVGEAQAAVDAWDEALRGTVRDLRAAECVDDGGEEAVCFEDVDVPDHVLVLCPHNPVAEGDPAVCGEPDMRVRFGDIRYDMISWITQPSIMEPVGLAWWSPDILTGETINGNAKVWASGVDYASAAARDAVLIAAGRMAPDEVPQSAYLHAWVQQVQAADGDPFGPAPMDLDAPRPPPPPPIDHGAAARLGRSAALAPLAGSRIEAAGIDASWLLMHGLDPSSAGPTAAPLAGVAMSQIAGERARLARRLEQIGGDLDLPADLDIASLVDELGDADEDEIYREIRRRFARLTFMHELGHVLGLRHNFAGSYDAVNYHPEYWAKRDRACAGQPRYLCPVTPAERSDRLHEYDYASVMDYHPSANAYLHGLGYYDVAAIKAGYGNLVEVFADPTIVDDPLAKALLQATYTRDQIAHVPLVIVPDASKPQGLRVTSVHYSRYPEVLGDLSRRVSIPSRRLADPHGMGTGTADAQGRVVVPYLSCADDVVNSMPYCLRYDRGADPYESVRFLGDWFRTYYPLNNFRRGRLHFEPADYVDAMWSRVFQPLKRWNAWLIHTRFDWNTTMPEAYTDPDFLEPMVKGSEAAFQFLASLLATPEPGPYLQDTLPDGTTRLSLFRQPIATPLPEPTTGVVTRIEFPLGRLYESAAAYDAGLYLLNIGSAVDKELALEALLDPSFFFFPGRETWEATELWMLNFYDEYPTQLVEVLGALIAGDDARFAPRFLDGAVTFPRYVAGTVPAGQPIEPAVGYTLRIRALIYGVALMYSGYTDRSFLDRVRVFAVGADDEIVTAGPTVDLVHPDTGVTYRALSFLDGLDEVGIGARLLLQAQRLADAAAGANGEAPEVQVRAAAMLRRQLDLIEIARDLVALYDDQLFTEPASE